MMHYISEDIINEVNEDIVSFTSNWGAYAVQQNLHEGDVCAFEFGVKEGSLSVTVHTL